MPLGSGGRCYLNHRCWVGLAYAFNPLLSARVSINGLGYEHGSKRRYIDASLTLLDAGLYLAIAPFPWRGLFPYAGRVIASLLAQGEARCTHAKG